MILTVDPAFFVRSIAHAKIQPLVSAFGHRHARAELRILLILIQRLDVYELEQLLAVQATLADLDEASLIQIAGSVRQLTLDDAVAHARVAHDLDRAEISQRTGLALKCDRRLLWRAPWRLARRHAGVRIAVLAKLIHREFPRRDNLAPVARLADFQR